MDIDDCIIKRIGLAMADRGNPSWSPSIRMFDCGTSQARIPRTSNHAGFPDGSVARSCVERMLRSRRACRSLREPAAGSL